MSAAVEVRRTGTNKALLLSASILPFLMAATPAVAQTNAPTSVLSELESYLVNNDTNYNGWTNAHVSLWESAVFSSVNGTPGEAILGNDLGAEIYIHKYSLQLDSVTRFEQLAGDVGSQQVGLGYDYILHQLKLSAGLDVRDTFQSGHWQAVPYIELMKASTSLYGTAPFVRYSYPIQKSPGAGEVDIGLSVSF